MKFALTIAGSDSSAGAGMQQDLKTCTVLGVYCATVITSVTAQNTFEVTGIHDLPPDMVEKQIDAVMRDLPIEYGKTGMLSNADIVRSVAKKAREYGLKLVVDPVMVSKSGATLLREDAVASLKRDLLPMAYIVTPNAVEAEIISGIKIRESEDAAAAAQAIARMGARYVVVKGGHVGGDTVVDTFYDGNALKRYEYPRVPTTNTHGGGDTLSAALASYLSRGFEPARAYALARRFMQSCITESLQIGKGYGPVNPMHSLKSFRSGT
ncbi:MAG: bifunctional hydroxymethylpyrimidine kinase/phosphomethylpyrimidine kinase [Thermoprotei archaeon]